MKIRAVLMPALIAALCVCLSHSRNRVWHDHVSLWGDVVGKSPLKGRDHYNLGFAYSLIRDLPNAEREFGKALRLAPTSLAHNNMGSVYFLEGRQLEAEQHFKLAVIYNPRSPQPNYNLGVLCLSQKRFGEAERYFQKAIGLNPAYAEAIDGLGLLAAERGRFEEAVRFEERALRLQPGDEQYRENLSRARALLSGPRTN